jgi:predicted ATPase/DNA-binding CsgD family transcriptional regulator
MAEQSSGTAASQRAGNLSTPLTPLIGREKETAATCDLLRRATVRLLTLTGPGGIGKTRLALQVAAELRDDFADGVHFVNLAPISDPSLLAATIAHALDVRERADRPLTERLKEHLRGKQLLLVLDNFEQVVDAAPLVGELLAAAPWLKALVTSREPLRLAGEHEYAAPPLALPPHPATPPPTPGRGGEDLVQYAAVQLFIVRAQAVKADFVVTNENAPAIAAICQRLDGLPLAIELAAARVKLLPPQALLTRLDQTLKLLTGGARDAPARQQTMRATIEWSYNLLDAGEQRLFAQLGVFVGGCTLEAAEAVCNADGALPIDALDGLAALVDKSLLKQEEGKGGEPRFTMLETIREYALEQLEMSGEAEVLRRRHIVYYLTLAEAAEPRLHSAEQLDWMARLENEHDNLRAALAWSQTARDDVALGQRLAGALWLFWQMHGHHTEGRRWLEDALVRGSSKATPERAKALIAVGQLAEAQGDQARARARLETALALHRELEDKLGMALALLHLGRVARNQGDYVRAAALEEESLASFRTYGLGREIVWALLSLGDVALDQGDFPQAEARFREALSQSEALGDWNGSGWALINLGRIACRQGDAERAQAVLTESLARFRDVGNSDGMAATYIELGYVAQRRGETVQAAVAFAKGLTLLRNLWIGESITLGLEGVATLANARRQPARAARLFGAAESLRESAGMPLPPVNRADYERDLAAVRAQLDEAAFATAWAAGRALTLEEAFVEAERIALEISPAQKAAEAPGQAPQPTSAAADRLGTLTPREQQVLTLIVQGYTNRAIAEALVIAERTAEIHVSNILAKLGVTSRTQAAAYAVAQGLTAPPDA